MKLLRLALRWLAAFLSSAPMRCDACGRMRPLGDVFEFEGNTRCQRGGCAEVTTTRPSRER